MGIVDKFFGKAKDAQGTGLETPGNAYKYLFGQNPSQLNKAEIAGLYEKHHFLRATLGKLAQRASTIEYELFQIANKKVNRIEQHELLDLLENPNPICTGRELITWTVANLKLHGNAYWYIQTSETGNKPLAIYPAHPLNVKPKVGRDGQLIGYEMNKNGVPVLFGIEEIIHFRDVNPLNIHLGVGYVQALGETIMSDLFASRWNHKLFLNSGRPDALLISKEDQGDEQAQRILDGWNEKFQGNSSEHKVALVTGDMQYVVVAQNPKDMEFSKLHTMTRDDILATLGVPKSVMAITDDVNRANAETGVYVFLSETIEPWYSMYTDFLNFKLVKRFGYNLWLGYEDPTPADSAALDDHYTKGLNKWLTVNEIREEEGMEPVEGGDVLYVPLSQVPIGEGLGTATSAKSYVAMNSTKKTKSKQEKRLKRVYRKALRGNKALQLQEHLFDEMMSKANEMTVTKKDVGPLIEPVAGITKKGFSENDKKKLWKDFDLNLLVSEAEFKKFVEKLFSDQEARIKKQIKDKATAGFVKASDLDLVDWDAENEIFVNAATPLITQIVTESGLRAMALVGMSEFDPTDKVTAAFIKKRADMFSDNVNTTTKKRLKKSLAEGALAGESIPELAKRVSDVMKNRIESSAETIARTEVLSSSNAGTMFGYKQTGLVQKKEWLSTYDGRTRDAHKHANGQVVDIDKKFEVDGESLRYPGDPSGSAENVVNCRCTIIPVIGEE